MKRITSWGYTTWVLMIVLSATWNITHLRRTIVELAKVEAQANIKKDVIYRHWAAMHGGVYVPVSPQCKPNPYLTNVADRDVTTTTGKRLTLVNPSYMTRQVYEVGRKEFGVRGHITSLKLLSPLNKPDEWETRALERFDNGDDEVYSLETMEGEEYLRYMNPMIAKSSCLKCHGFQGYKVGQVRGGLSVSIPMNSYNNAFVTNITFIITLHVLLLLIGIVGIRLASKRMIAYAEEKNKALKERMDSEEKLNEQNDEYQILNSDYQVLNQVLTDSNAEILKVNTELLEAKRNIQLNEEKFIALIANSPIAIIITNEDGIITFASAMSQRVLGYPHEILVGTPITNLAHPDDIEKFKKQWLDILVNNSEMRDVEYRVLDANGMTRWISHSASYLKVGESFLGIQSTIINISHTKAIEAELIKAKDKAEDSDKQKSAFLANMSHEIRTPMNGILGFSQRLTKPNLTDQKREQYVKIINNCGNQLLTLIDDLIDTAKIEANQIKINNTTVRINDVLTELYDIFRSRVEITGVELKVVKPLGDADAIVVTDNVRLRQVITNLLSNAVKFTNSGKIVFGYNVKGNVVEFFVEDTGIGIKSEQQRLVFERFKQADQSISQHFGGSGLGLSISRALVLLMGGDIWVKSVVNRGSTFFFTIPLVKPTSKPEHEPGPTLQKIVDDNRPLIIADGDDGDFDISSKIVSGLGFNVLRARNGSQLMKLVNDNPTAHVVIIDLAIPGIDVYTTPRLLVETNPNIKIIAQATNAFVSDRDRINTAGYIDIIIKPVDPEVIINLLQTYT